MVQKLTDVGNKDPKVCPAPATGNKIYYDTEVRGFGLRVTAAGAKSFILNYYTNSGRERRYTIGQFPDWKTTAAREEAKRLKQQIRVNGFDPVAGIEAERGAKTMADLATRYLEQAQGKRTLVDDERIFRTFVLPALGSKKVAEVTFSDVDGLHRKLTRGSRNRRATPYRANRVVALLSKAFNLAIKWGWRPERDNPCKGIERNPEPPRERFLSGDELLRLTDALTGHSDQEAANAIRLLLLTGARRGEVLGLLWDQIDFENHIWSKPSSHTKQKKVHTVPLSPPALQLLAQMKEEAEKKARKDNRQRSDFVFPGRGGIGHRVDLKKQWPVIRKAAGIANLRPHDLRHSFASILVAGGATLPMIGRLLGHTQVSTTQRYAHLDVNPLRELTERVGAIVTGKPAGEVVGRIKDRAER